MKKKKSKANSHVQAAIPVNVLPAVRKTYRLSTGKLLFLALLWQCCFFYPAFEYDNTISRFLFLSAVVDFGTLNINRYHDFTCDKSANQYNYYSNKAIGAPLVAIPFYWFARHLPFSKGDFPLALYHRVTVSLVTTSLLSVFCGVVLWRLVLVWGASPVSALFMVAAVYLGSIAWIHSQQFSGHMMAGAFSLIAFSGLYFLKNQKKFNLSTMLTGGLPVGCGLCAGLGGLCDYTALFIAMVLAVYLLGMPIKWTQKVLFFAAAACCALILAGYNYRCFGSPFTMSYARNAAADFAEGSRSGLLGVSLPSVQVLLQLMFSSYRGLFFMMPVFLFSIAGLVKMRALRNLRAEFWVLIVVIVGYFCINAGFYGWHGGWSHGPRYLVPMLPFLALPMALINLRSWLFIAALAVSFLQMVPGAVICTYAPPELINPIVELLLPLMQLGYRSDSLGALFGLGAIGSFFLWIVVLGICSWLLYRRASWETPEQPARVTKRPYYYPFVIGGGWFFLVIVTVCTMNLRTADTRIKPYYIKHFMELYRLPTRNDSYFSERYYLLQSGMEPPAFSSE